MNTLSAHNITVLFLSLGVLLGASRILGEIARRLHQPAILGELLAGVLLGPTILGRLAPGLTVFLFPAAGPNALALDAITNVAIVLFLLVAGIEVDLSTIWRQGRLGIKVGISSVIAPFIFGFAGAMVFPKIMGSHAEADILVFSLFFATALSISALPVIAKTLMDIDLYRSDMGMVVISAAVFNDLVGWIIFAVILSMLDSNAGHVNHIGITITLTLLFSGFMLTAGRWLIHRVLPFLQAYTQWPGGVLGFALTLAFFGASFTEWIGIHAVFGSFLVGVAIGDSSHLREQTRVTIEHFVSFIFAPLFFAGIGLNVDFLAHFDSVLVLTVLVIACTLKLIGSYAGARWGKMTKQESWAVGFALNSRGAMEIILGLLALQAGIIRHRLFVALVIMAIVTSVISGPGMKMVLRSKKKRYLHDILSGRYYIKKLKSRTRREAIHEMALVACDNSEMNYDIIENAVWSREEVLSTGIGNRIALPHARLDDLKKSVVVAAISDAGIDFDAPDGKPANLIFMLLTPTSEPSAQLEYASEIARLFRNQSMVDQILRTDNFTEFLAMIKHIGSVLKSQQR